MAQADTIVPGAGNPMAWDRYAYTLNNPTSYNDPSGHMRQCPNYDGLGSKGTNCDGVIGSHPAPPSHPPSFTPPTGDPVGPPPPPSATSDSPLSGPPQGPPPPTTTTPPATTVPSLPPYLGQCLDPTTVANICMAGGGGYYFAAYWTVDQDLGYFYISAVGVDYSASYNIAFFSNATAIVVNETFEAFRGVDGTGVIYPTLLVSTQSGANQQFGLDDITGTGSRQTMFIIPGADRPITMQIRLLLHVDGAWSPMINNVFYVPLANPPVPR